MSDPKLLIDIKGAIKGKWRRFAYSLVAKPLESFLGFSAINRAYDYFLAHPEYGNFFNRAVCAIGFSYEVDEKELKKIPAEGPLIVVSNHPLGGLDGITMGAVLLGVREDAKLMLNSLLSRMPDIREWSIEVNPFGGSGATAQNIAAMKETLAHLKKGGCLGVFPSGTVSYLNIGDFSITDPEWNTNVAQIARRTGAKILPVYFEGKNSWLFYALGLIHPRLRTLMLVREMMRFARKRRPVRMRIGTPLDARRVAQFNSDAELTSWMRINSYVLGSKKYQNAEEAAASRWQIKNIDLGKIFPRRHKCQELILPVDPEKMRREIEALPESAAMIKGDKISVYCAEAWQIPHVLMEIGRLREKTFREVGEGTGKSLDNDEFDQYYLHMFMWDSQAKKIAGAYRVGRTDKIINAMGMQGLYISTLFKVTAELFEKISPALEMGRSFIVSEYQKKRSTLAILWRGIGEYLSRHPRYKTLYGPVSISTEYNSISKDLIVQFLRERKTSGELSKLVKAKKPPKIRLKSAERQALLEGAQDIDHISALVSEIEIDNKGIPTLLKHYLKLDGELLAFNIDSSFGSCIDGLIMVNLLKTDPKLLKSYMGAEQTVSYRAFHGLDTPELSARKDCESPSEK